MAEVKVQCGRCGIDLQRISYVEPDWKGFYNGASILYRRQPLCRPCWEKADEEAREAAKGAE